MSFPRLCLILDSSTNLFGNYPGLSRGVSKPRDALGQCPIVTLLISGNTGLTEVPDTHVISTFCASNKDKIHSIIFPHSFVATTHDGRILHFGVQARYVAIEAVKKTFVKQPVRFVKDLPDELRAAKTTISRRRRDEGAIVEAFASELMDQNTDSRANTNNLAARICATTSSCRERS